jgi:hypothetical protein
VYDVCRHLNLHLNRHLELQRQRSNEYSPYNVWAKMSAPDFALLQSQAGRF